METASLTPRPPGLIFDTPKPREQAGKILFKRTIAMDLGPESKINLLPEEKKRMEKYEAPKATMWSSTDKEEPFPPKQTIFVLNGLASNPDQLENDGSSLVHKIITDLGDDAKNVNIVSISCPGFGESNFTQEVLKDEANGPKNTSVNEYVEMTKIWLKSMNLNSENTIISGHSAGAEAAVHFVGDAYQVYALNPALHVGKSDIFRGLAVLNEITRHTQKHMPSVINGIGQFITDKLVGNGNDASSMAQSDVHANEQQSHQDAFRFKSKELIDPDVFPEGFNKDKLRVLITKGDILTPSDQSVEWLKAWVKQKQPDIQHEKVDEVVNSLLIPLDSTLSSKSGHDGLFIDPSISAVLSSELSSLTKSRIYQTDLKRAVQEIGNLTELAKSKEGKSYLSDKDAQTVMYQGITLELWIEGAKMIRDRTKDNKISFSKEDSEQFISLFTKHPALQNKFGDNLDSEIKKYGGLLQFLMELYGGDPYPDISKAFHLFYNWEDRFADALSKRPDIADKLRGDTNRFKASSVLIDSRMNLVVFLSNAMNRKGFEVPMSDELITLNNNHEALELFRENVRERFASTILGNK